MDIQHLLEIKNGINFIAGFNNLLLIYLLIRNYKTASPANGFLIIFTFGMGMVNLMIYLYDTHILEDIPWLFRMPSPIFYAMFPSAWLYVRMLVNDETKMRKWDWLHFLPALLHLLEMMPYYFSTLAHKELNLAEAYNNPLGNYLHNEGMLPGYVHNAIRGFIGLIYCWFIFKELQNTFKRDNPRSYQFLELKSWLNLFGSALLIFSTTIFISFAFPQLLPPIIKSFLVEITSAFTQIITCITLLRRPYIMFGIPKPHILVEQKEELLIQNHPSDYDKYIQILDNYAKTQISFLQAGFSIRDLSLELNIPQHHLSYVLNRIFHIRFNDYINKLRIQYIKQHVSPEKMQSRTLEGLALEAGFGNRTTFIRAVKKLTGEKPSIYFNTLEELNES
ncbi:MAG: helix-turn-helix domain-containing protein [Sphingobacteriia bacterium]